jgi:hypothetical protein
MKGKGLGLRNCNDCAAWIKGDTKLEHKIKGVFWFGIVAISKVLNSSRLGLE